MNREVVLRTAGEAINQRLSPDSLNQLRAVAQQYGKHHKISAAVENWLGDIEDTEFENFSTRAQTDKWLDEWLSRLP